jgi:hypothetical protein
MKSPAKKVVKRPGVFASYKEQRAMEDLLHKHLKKGADDRFYYEPGWSDAKIAQAVNPALNENHAARIRKEIFGDTFKRSRPHSGDLTARVENLEKLVDRLIARLGEDTNALLAD